MTPVYRCLCSGSGKTPYGNTAAVLFPWGKDGGVFYLWKRRCARRFAALKRFSGFFINFTSDFATSNDYISVRVITDPKNERS